MKAGYFVKRGRRLSSPAQALLALVNVGCNSLFDIEPHRLASRGDEDAAVSEPTHEDVSPDGAAPVTVATDAAAQLSRPDAASEHTSAQFSSAAGSTGDAAQATRTDSSRDVSSQPATATPTDSGDANGGSSGDSTAPVSSEPPPDPRYNAPTEEPNFEVGIGCASKLDAWGHTSYCRFTPNGFDANGNPLASVGDVHLWVYWSEAAVDGWICVIDNASNGRGIKYQVAVHPVGAGFPTLPADNFTYDEPAWPVVYAGRDNEQFGTCTWTKFAAAQAVDQVMVEWMDVWTSQHFDGRYFIDAP